MFEARTCTNVVRPRHPEPRAFHEQGPLHAKVVCSRKRRWCVQNAFVREQTPVPAKPIRSRTNAGACKIHLFANESCRRAHAKGQICLRPGREDRVSQRLTVPQAFATKPYAKGRTGRIASLLHYFRDYCAARDLSGEDSIWKLRGLVSMHSFDAPMPRRGAPMHGDAPMHRRNILT